MSHVLGTRRSLVFASVNLAVVGALLHSPSALAISKEQSQQAENLANQATREMKNLKTQDLALKHMDAALAINPANGLLWSVKASFLSAVGDDEQARVVIDKAVQLDPRSAHIWSKRAELYMGAHNKNKEEVLKSIVILASEI